MGKSKVCLRFFVPFRVTSRGHFSILSRDPDLSRKPPKTLGTSNRFSKRTMLENNGWNQPLEEWWFSLWFPLLKPPKKDSTPRLEREPGAHPRERCIEVGRSEARSGVA